MKAVGVLLLLCVLAGCGVSVWAEAADSTAVAQADATVAAVSDSEVEAEAAAEVEAAAEQEAESDAEAEADIEAEADAEADTEAEAEAEGEMQSQAELDAAHENAVATLEQYAEKAHALRDEIITSEHSLMEQMAAIDTCPPSELKGLMARAKKQITHLFQIKALYLAIKQQEKQLRALLDAGTGKRAPNVAPKNAAPAAPKATKKAAAKPAKATAADAAGLNAMNTKLVNALARLEQVTARLAKVERRQGKGRKATLVIAAQMEKDEKRLNKHSRVLRRLRKRQHTIRAALKRLAASCKRGKKAERRITKRTRKSRRGGKPAGKKAAAKKPAAKKAAGKKSAKKSKKAVKKPFDLNACFARCAKRSDRRQSHCVRVCRRRASGKPARRGGRRGRRASRKGKKGSRKGRKSRRGGRRPRALKRCLRKCRKANPVAQRAAAKKCAVSCFRRHAHRRRGSRRGRRVSRRRGGRKGKRSGKRSFNLKKCLAKCPRSRKNAKRRSRKCTRKCHRSARAARGGKKRRANPALKKCFKTCRKGKKWNMKCVRSCRSKHGKKRRGAKKWSSKKLKACFKTCRGKSRVVVRRNKKTGKSRRIRVKGKWNKPCVRSCRKRFGKPKSKKSKKSRRNPALQKCYKTCKKGKVNGKRQWDMKCVRRCRTRFGRKARKAPHTAAYKACLKRCRPGKAFRKCKKACAKHNRISRLPRIKSPSRKAVAVAMKGLKKTKKAKKSRPETWEDVVRQSRRLLKKTVRLRNLVHKQVARHFDTKDVEGRKYNGWWSIYDVLKGVKPGAHYTGRAKEIAADVKQIMQPALAKAADGPYGEIVNVLKSADEAHNTKFTRELGSPALDLTVDPKFTGYVEKPLPGARIKHVPYNPKKPYDPSQHTWHKTPPLSRLPEIRDEKYDENLAPIYARQFKITPRKAPQAEQPFALRSKNWDYPQIPYSYPVTMVSHDPTYKNPHVRAPTPGFHAEWPEFRFQQTATSADAEANAAAAAPQAPASQQPMTEGTNDA